MVLSTFAVRWLIASVRCPSWDYFRWWWLVMALDVSVCVCARECSFKFHSSEQKILFQDSVALSIFASRSYFLPLTGAFRLPFRKIQPMDESHKPRVAMKYVPTSVKKPIKTKFVCCFWKYHMLINYNNGKRTRVIWLIFFIITLCGSVQLEKIQF